VAWWQPVAKTGIAFRRFFKPLIEFCQLLIIQQIGMLIGDTRGFVFPL
jgi:hypothetical protein